MKFSPNAKCSDVCRAILVSAFCLMLLPLKTYASGNYPTDSFAIPEGAYSARFIEDRNNVTVMEFAGNYNMELEGENFNRAARAVIAKEFFTKHPDNYDFIVTFTSFEFETEEATAFYHGVRNDVKGIGKPIFDNSAIYGSKSKLQGFIDMAAVSRYNLDPFSPEFDWPLSVMAHEVLHRWGTFVRFKDADGNPNTALLGRDGSHWNFYLDTKASVQYGHQWEKNADGSFTAVATRKFYSPLDLYLMGFYPPEQVPDFFFINPVDAPYTPANLPVKGARVKGSQQFVSVNDIINFEGSRIPDAKNSQKEFRFAFIYLKQAGDDINDQHIAGINALRKAFIERFSIMTGGRGIAHVYPEVMPVAELGSDDGVSATDDIRLDDADVNDALAWLRGQQHQNGYWQDTEKTRLRDSGSVYLALAELDKDFAQHAQARAWLGNQPVTNTDSLARKLMALKTDAEAANQLVIQQANDGGWGLMPNYASNSLDTALAVEALALNSAAAVTVSKGMQYLLSAQNADSGWPESPKGASTERATAAAIRALAAANSTASSKESINKALTWLASRQRNDGGFGSNTSSINETAEVMLAAIASRADHGIDMGAAAQYLTENQRISGAWEGSVYTTATAVRALQSLSLPNLKIQTVTANKTSVLDGERITFTITITNDSPLVTPATTIQLYRGNPNAGGVSIHTPVNLPGLTPHNTVSVDMTWDTLDQQGQQVIYAVVDPQNLVEERSTTDNTKSLAIEVKDAPTNADLEFNATEFLIAPANPSVLPTQLAVSAVLRNLGKTGADNVTVQFWEGQPNSSTGRLVDEEVINVPARTSTATNFVVDLTKPGSVSYTVIADPHNNVTEANKENNQARRIISTQPSLDLAVVSSDIVINTSPVVAYQDVNISVTLRNQGTMPTPSTHVNYVIQNENGTSVIENNQVSLGAGETKTFELIWRSDFLGASNFVVEIDKDNLVTEANETNNTASVVINSQQLQGANLAVTARDLLFTPNPALEGLGVTLSAKITNTGTVALTSVPVSFYEGEPSAGGALIGQVIIPDIAPGQVISADYIWPQVPTPAERLIFVVVDPETQIVEFNETDNKAFSKLPVRSLPDLQVSEGSIRLEPQFPKIGDTATVVVTVSNQGKQPANNVRVRAYRGTAESGVEIGNGVVIPVVDSFANGIANFSFDVSEQGTEIITVVVDPEQQIHESVRSNNQASKNFAVQDGDFYVTERFISPNGDGIKDTSSFFFRLATADTVSVSVVDYRGRALRKFKQVFEDTKTGNVTWDGLSDAGAIVLDGRYQLVVENNQGEVLGNASVEVDTNRSSLLEALGTQYQLDRNLSCLVGDVVNNQQPALRSAIPAGDKGIIYSPDNEFIYFATYFNPVVVNGETKYTDDNTLHPTGIYRANRNGTEITRLVTKEQLENFNIQYIAVSSDGARLAIVVGGQTDYVIWTLDADDGENLRIAKQGAGENRYFKTATFIPGTHDLLIASYDANNRSLFLEAIDASEPGLVGNRNIASFSNYFNDHAYYNGLDVLLSPNNIGQAVVWVTPSYTSYGDYGDLFVNDLYELFTINVNTGAYKYHGDRVSAFAWSPNSKQIALGDPSKGGIVILDTAGNELQRMKLPKQYTIPAEFDYINSALPAAFRHDQAVLGRIAGVSWNPDGTELGFVFEDYADGFITQQIHLSTGDHYGYGNTPIEEIDLAPFNVKKTKGVYVADITSNTLERHADITPLPGLSGIAPGGEIFDISKLKMDEFGNFVSAEGLPIIPWMESPWWSQSDRTSRRKKSIAWMEGARALLISGFVTEYNYDNNHSDESRATGNRTFVVGFDSKVNTRELFTERSQISDKLLVPTSTGKHISLFSQDEKDKCTSNGRTRGHRQVESLLNLTSDLRVIRSSKNGGLLLQGTAIDKNFDSYRLEFAYIDTPDQWHSIMPSSNTSLIDKQFTTWVPPDKGNYFVRLTVADLAGNSRQIVKRASISERPSVTNLYRSPAYISPNSDNLQDSVTIHFKILEPINLEVNIFNDDGALVRTIERSYTEIGSEHDIIWDGRNNQGQRVADGTYRMAIQNYDFFVDVDTSFPVIKNLTPALLYVWPSPPECKLDAASAKCYTEIDTSLQFETTDINYLPTLSLEYKQDGDAEWAKLDIDPKEVKGTLKLNEIYNLNEWVKGQFRAIAVDRAENRTVLQFPSSGKRNQIYLTDAAYVKNYDGENKIEAQSGGNTYYEPQGALNSPLRVATNPVGALVFKIVESISNPITNVEVLYKKESATSAFISTPITAFGKIKSCVGNGLCFVENSLFINSHGDHYFELSWDYSDLSLDSDTYRAYVRVTDSENNSYISNSVAFGGGNLIGISDLMAVTDGCFDSEAGICDRKEGGRAALAAYTTADWQQYSSIDMYVSSKDDQRYSREILSKTITAENSRVFSEKGVNHYVFSAEDFVACNTYSVRMVFTNRLGQPASMTKEIKSPCMELMAVAYPVLPESCNAPASGKAQIKMIVTKPNAGSYIESVKLQLLTVSRIDAAQANNDILFNINDPSFGKEYIYEISTLGFEEGTLNLEVKIQDVNGTSETETVEVPIVHSPPSLDLTYPIHGEKYCAVSYSHPVEEKKGLELQGISKSKNIHTYSISTRYNQVDDWMVTYCEPDTSNIRYLAYEKDPLCGTENNIGTAAPIIANQETNTSRAKGTLGVAGLGKSGKAEILFESYNWSGAHYCSEISIDVDAEVEGLGVYPSKALASLLKIKNVGIYAPGNPDSLFSVVGWDYSIGESVNIDIKIVSLTLNSNASEFSEGSTVDTPYESYAVLPGTHKLEWNDASSAADGYYRAIITTTDACGNKAIRKFDFEIDKTPPTTEITYPLVGASLGLIVEPIGSVSDKNNATYVLAFGKSEDQLAPLKSPADPGGWINTILGQWNTYGLEGAWLISLTTTDQLGNSTRKLQEISLPERVNLISLLEAENRYVSPNNDGRLERSTLRVEFESDVKVDVVVLKDGQQVDTIVEDKIYNKGRHQLIWNAAQPNGSAFNDGIYQIQVSAELAEGSSTIQTEAISVILDATLPTIDLVEMVNNRIGIKNKTLPAIIKGEILDSNFKEYAINLIEVPSGAVSTLLDSDHVAPVGVIAIVEQEQLNEEGYYTVQISASDLAENISTTTVKLLVDTIAPVVEVSSPVSGIVLNKNASLEISGLVEEENLDSYAVTLAPASAPQNLLYSKVYASLPSSSVLGAIDITNLVDNAYLVKVQAIDLVGTVTSKSISVVIDNTPPMAEIIQPNSNGYITGAVVIKGTAADTNYLQHELLIAEGLSGSSFTSIQLSNNTVTDGNLLNWVTLPEDGEYTLQLKVTDKAGNISDTKQAFTIDTKPPATPELQSALFNKAQMSVGLTWLAVDDDELAGYHIYRNGQRLTAAPINLLAYTDAGAIEGKYVYGVSSVDKAGLESEIAKKELAIDVTPPSANIVRPIKNTKVSGIVPIIGTAASPDDFKEYRLLVGPVDGALIPIASSLVPVNGGELGQWDTLSSNEGVSYHVRVEAEDINGNVGSEQILVAVDNTPPSPPTNLIGNITGGNNVQLTWTISPETDVTGYLLFRNDRLANATGIVIGDLTPYAIAGSAYQDKNVVDGKHTYVVIAIDGAGNFSAPSEPVQLTIDIRAPHAVFTGVENMQAFEDSLYLAVEVADEDVAEVAFEYMSVDAQEWVPLVIDKALPFNTLWDTSALELGEYYLRAIAKDFNANVDENPSVIVVRKGDLTPPSTIQTLSVTVSGAIVNLMWQADEEGESAQYILERKEDMPGKNWVRLNSNPIPETSYADNQVADGRYQYRVIAVDAANNEADPSSESLAIVFTPNVVEPYTPTELDVINLQGKTLALSTLRISVIRDGQSVFENETTATTEGQFVFNTIGLELGKNRIVITATNPSGFVSNPVVYEVNRATAPAQVTGALASLSQDESLVDVSWNNNPESNISGYRIYRDGESITPVSKINNITPLLNTQGHNLQNVFDGNQYSYWLWGVDANYLDLQFEQLSLVNEIEIKWYSSNLAYYKYKIMAWSGDYFVTVAEVDYSDTPHTDLHTITFEKPYFTDRLRIVPIAAVGNGYLSEIEVRELKLSNTTDYFTDEPQDGYKKYRISAINSYGLEGALSDEVEIAYGDVIAPEAVTLSAEVVGSNVALLWTASTSDDVAEYRLYRNDVLIANLDQLELAYTDQALQNGTYTYRVRPVDAVGNIGELSNSVEATIAIAVLPAPVDLAVVADGTSGHLSLTWKPAPDSGAPKDYAVYRSTSNNSQFVLLATTGNPYYLDQGVVIGTTYYYHVRARDLLQNQSAPSNEVVGVPLDNVAPSIPVISKPTVSGAPIVVSDRVATIAGRAEPGSTLSLIRNNAIDKSLTLPVEYPELSLAGHQILDVAESSFGAMVVLARSQEWTHKLYIIENNKIQFIMNRPSDFYSEPHSVMWVGSDILISSPYQMALINPLSKTVKIFNPPFQWWGYINKLVAYYPMTGSVLFIGEADSRYGLISYDLNKDKLTVVVDDYWGVYERFGSGKLSPNGKLLGVINDETAEHRRLYTFNLESFEHASYLIPGGHSMDQNVSWSADSKQVLVTSLNGSGHQQVVMFDLSKDESTIIASDTAKNFTKAVWSFDSKFLAYEVHGQETSKVIVENLESGQTNVAFDTESTMSLDSLYWSANNTLLIGQTVGFNAKRLPGQFIIPNVNLIEGDNIFSAFATDATGNESPLSQSIRVSRIQAPRPDLVITAEVKPLLATVNSVVNAKITITNTGVVPAPSSLVDVTSRNSQGITENLITGKVVPALAVGESVTFPIEWTVKNISSNRILFVADANKVITESSEVNNLASVDITVVENATPFVSVDLESSINGNFSFKAHEPITGNMTVTNAGASYTGSVFVLIEDVDGYPVAELLRHSISSLAHGGTVKLPITWNTGTTFAGNYKLSAKLLDGTGIAIDTDNKDFVIVEDIRLLAGVTTQSPSYTANADVIISATLANNGGNTLFAGGEIEVIISRLVGGEQVGSFRQVVGEVLPGDKTKSTFVWNTSKTQPGNYRVTYRVLNKAGTSLLVSLAEFEIRASIPQVVGKFGQFNNQLGMNTAIDVPYMITNTGNSSIESTDIQLQLLNVASGDVLRTTTAPISLGYGATAEQVISLDVTDLPLGNYLLVLNHLGHASANMKPLSLDKKSVAIVDTIAPVVRVVSPEATSVINSERARVIIEAIDNETSIANVSVKIDNLPDRLAIRDNESADLFSISTNGLADGAHQFSLAATDRAGNISSPLMANITVDNTPPVVTVSGVIDGELYAQNVTPVISVNDPHLAVTNIELNGETYQSGATITLDGRYRLAVTAEDKAGNLTRHVVLFEINKVEASINVDGVSDGAVYNYAVIPVIQTAGVQPGSVVISLNGQSFVTGTEVVEEGSYLLRIKANGIAGNLVERIVSFRLDYTAPLTPQFTYPTNNASLSEAIIEVKGSAEIDSFVTLAVNNGESKTMVATGGVFVFSGIQLVEGSNILEVRSRDVAGNYSAASTINVSFSTASNVVVNPGINQKSRVLIWVPEKHNGHFHKNTKDLLDLMTSAYEIGNTPYYVATSPNEFLDSLRTQQYNVINLINLEHMPLHCSGSIFSELQASVLSGTGLVVVNTKPGSLNVMNEILGAKTTGKLSNLVKVVFAGDVIDGEYNWNIDEFALKLTLDGGIPIGDIHYRCGHNTCKQPALVTNNYGKGKTMLVPFSLTDVPKPSEVKAFINTIASYVTPATTTVLPSTLTNVSWFIDGLGANDNIIVQQDLSSELGYFATYGGNYQNDHAVWNINGHEGNVDIGASILTPSIKGDYEIRSSIYNGVVSSGTLLEEDVFELDVQKSLDEIESELVHTIQTLNVPSSQRKYRDIALVNLKLAVAVPLGSRQHAELAIFLMSNTLAALTEINKKDALVKAAELMKVYESVWTVRGIVSYGKCSLIDPNANGHPAWDSRKIYNGGEKVNYKNLIWEARWWNIGANPESLEAPWILVSDVEYPWHPSFAYETSDEVNHKGRRWRAKWWVRSNEPGTISAWLDIGASTCP